MNSPSAIQTHAGLYFDVMAPRPEEVRLDDIIHALSHVCRFAGHVARFYSVAAHVMFVADLVRDELHGEARSVLYALLHENGEAYLCDLPRPLKYATGLGEAYRAIEERVMDATALGLNLPVGFHHDALVKQADEMAAALEAVHLMRTPSWATERIRELGLEQLLTKYAYRFARDTAPAYTRRRLREAIAAAARLAKFPLSVEEVA